MFFAVFWTAYLPICIVILSLAGERLMHSVRQLRVPAWIASSNRRRIRRGRSEDSEAVLGDPMHEPVISGGAVRKLWAGETELYRQHLLRLDAESRRNRFGGAVSDEFIRLYSGPSTLNGAVIYGFFCRGRLTRRCRVAPAFARRRSRDGVEHRADVAEPRRGNGVARARAARGAQPEDRTPAYALPRRKPTHAAAGAEIRR